MVPESVEVHHEDGAFSNPMYCPEDGAIWLYGLPNDPSIVDVVFFSEPVDGEVTYETIELARFQLPE